MWRGTVLSGVCLNILCPGVDSAAKCRLRCVGPACPQVNPLWFDLILVLNLAWIYSQYWNVKGIDWTGAGRLGVFHSTNTESNESPEFFNFLLGQGGTKTHRKPGSQCGTDIPFSPSTLTLKKPHLKPTLLSRKKSQRVRRPEPTPSHQVGLHRRSCWWDKYCAAVCRKRGAYPRMH